MAQARAAVSIRRATARDLDRLVVIHAACYPDARDAATRRRNFLQNPLGPLSSLRVAVRDGVLVGHAFGFSAATFIGGAPVKTLGIASVGVAPEARGSGVASAMLSALEDEARSRGACLAMLHAFRHGFYARRGYADVSPSVRLTCDSRAVPKSWADLAKSAKPRAATVRDVGALSDVHRRAAARTTGWLDRPAALWKQFVTSERVNVFVLEKKTRSKNASVLRGYVAFELVQSEPHDRTRLNVHELVADDDETRATLWGLLGLQIGQITEFEIEVAQGDAITFALTDIDGAHFGDEIVEHDLGRLVAGPMIRVLDVARSLGARGYAANGALDLVVAGERMHLTIEHGRARVAKRPSRAPVELDAQTLASVAFGGLRLADAVRLGRAHGDASAIANADTLFRTPPFFTLDRF